MKHHPPAKIELKDLPPEASVEWDRICCHVFEKYPNHELLEFYTGSYNEYRPTAELRRKDLSTPLIKVNIDWTGKYWQDWTDDQIFK